jgi:hypothetical protein
MGDRSRYTAIVATVVLSTALFCFSAANVQAATPSAGITTLDGVRQQNITGIGAGSSLAVGDIDADGVDEIVAGSAPGVAASVSIYEQNGQLVRKFSVFRGMSLGVTIALGNFSGKGALDIIVAPRRGGGPHVLRYDKNGKQLTLGFFAYAKDFHGGVNLAAGDVDGDGTDEILTAPLTGGGPHVSFFRANGTRLGNLFPFESSYRGGLSLAAVDITGDGRAEIAAVPLGGRVTEVRISDPFSRKLLLTARPFGTFSGGADLAVLRRAGVTELLASAGAGGGPHVTSINLQTGARGSVSVFPIAQTWRGGIVAKPLTYSLTNDVSLAVSAGSLSLTAAQLSSYSGTTGTSTTGFSFKEQNVVTTRGTFAAEIITVDLSNPNLRVLTVSSARTDCFDNCPVHSLGDHVKRVAGTVGINGSYFCPIDYSGCANQDGSTYWAWYDSPTGGFPHLGQNRFNGGGMLAFDALNRPTLYAPSSTWPSQTTYEELVGQKLRAALSNGPLLMKNGAVVVTSGELDSKQLTVKSHRSGVAVKGTTMLLVVAKGATVLDLGAVMKALGATTAINLDGGGSSALYYNGEYKVGPGRNIPNAIVVART